MSTQTASVSEITQIGLGWKGYVDQKNVNEVVAYINKLLNDKAFSLAVTNHSYISSTQPNLELTTSLRLNRDKVEIGEILGGQFTITFFCQFSDGRDYEIYLSHSTVEDLMIEFRENELLVKWKRKSFNSIVSIVFALQ